MKVRGYCPLGCGETLKIAVHGVDDAEVVCSNPACREPLALSEIIGDPETEHIVELREEDYSLQHPLRERLGGALYDCPAHRWPQGLDAAPVPRGRYRMVWNGDPDYGFEPIE